MGYMKRYFEERIDELTDEELMEMGYSKEDIDEIRGIFTDEESLRRL